MANTIKYSGTNETNALNKGNWYIGVGDVDKGPTETTGFYAAGTPPVSGYTIYTIRPDGIPSMFVANNDQELIILTNQISYSGFTTVAECLNYFATQDDKMVVNKDYEPIVTDGLVLNLDAENISSFVNNNPTTNYADTDFKRTIQFHNQSGYGNDGSVSDAPEKGPGWKKITITNRGSNFRIAQFPYINHPADTNRTYALEYDFGSTSGYYWRLDGNSGTNGNYIIDDGVKFALTWDSPGQNRTEALFLMHDTYNISDINDTIYYRYYQVENALYATDFTTGSRSQNTTWYDLSGNKNNGTLTNGVSYEDESLVFDGVDDYIDLGSDITFKATGGWTVESVVKYNSVAGGYNNLTSPANFIGAGSISYNSWYWSVLNSKLALWNISPGVWKYGSTTLQADTWYHAVLVSYDSGTSYQMYLNGEAEGGNHTTYSWNSSYAGLKVRYIGAGQTTRRYINGKIPVTKIYDRALTASEVLQNYNAQKSRFGL